MKKIKVCGLGENLMLVRACVSAFNRRYLEVLYCTGSFYEKLAKFVTLRRVKANVVVASLKQLHLRVDSNIRSDSSVPELR